MMPGVWSQERSTALVMTRLRWLVTLMYVGGAALISLLQPSELTPVPSLPALYWLGLVGALSLWTIAAIIQVRFSLALVKFSRNYGWLSIVTGLLLLVLALTPLQVLVFGLTGTGVVTGGEVL